MDWIRGFAVFITKMVWLLCQLPVRIWHCARSNRLIRFIGLLLFLLVYCEFLHYYFVLLFCKWPSLRRSAIDITPMPTDKKPLKVMIIADTHLLGFREGHWFDKLRREWQMERSFQTTMMIHNPDVVFLLGDVLDEGKWCSDKEFRYHVKRFKKMFATPHGTEMYFVSGNHDEGFHYMMTDSKHKRFEKAFASPSVKMVQIRGNIFVLLNSMTMEGDGCNLCSEAVSALEELSWQLKCAQSTSQKKKVPPVCAKIDKIPFSRPILMQHFPMYRSSDANCTTLDAAPPEEKEILFRPKWDCLSKESSENLFEWLKPRLIVSGHTHHGCHRVHDDGTPEWTVASFSWRNKKNPTFLLTVISPDDFAISQCFLPNESTVYTMYVTGCIFALLYLIFPYRQNRTSHSSTSMKHN